MSDEKTHTKAYKVELLIIDHEQIGIDEIWRVIENTKYPNHCITPDVKRISGESIGEWSDEHPLNHKATALAEYERLFK